VVILAASIGASLFGVVLLGATTAGVAAAADTNTASTTNALTQAPTPAATAKNEAIQLFGALQRNYYLGAKQLYKGAPTGQCGTYSCLWPFTNATAGTAFLYATPGESTSAYLAQVNARVTGLAHYADAAEVSPAGAPQPPAYESEVGPPLGSGGATYYDDNAWAGLNLIHAYLATSNASDLTLAQDEFNFVVAGWDTSTTDGCPGGVFWEDVAGSQRNTTRTAPTPSWAPSSICSRTTRATSPGPPACISGPSPASAPRAASTTIT
jgi:hypothetical protein